jgi:hypothetical protein
MVSTIDDSWEENGSSVQRFSKVEISNLFCAEEATL